MTDGSPFSIVDRSLPFSGWALLDGRNFRTARPPPGGILTVVAASHRRRKGTMEGLAVPDRIVAAKACRGGDGEGKEAWTTATRLVHVVGAN
jgi:hypothetical protein